MKKIIKNNEKIVFTTDMGVGLANAIRRSANEIPILAVDVVDIYKNDSALYDEVLAHRLGLVPLKNQKTKEGDFVEIKLKSEAKGKQKEVLSEELGEISVYDSIPITLLNNEQEIEIVAKARQGKAVEHAKFSAGQVYYRILNKIIVEKEAEKKQEIANSYPKYFNFKDGKLQAVADEIFDLEIDDVEELKGIKSVPTEEIVFTIESWGQISAEDIFLDAVKVLNKNLDEVKKELK